MIDKEILWPDTPFDLEPSLVLLGRRGSEAHGTWIKPEDPNGIDDRDLMGIVIPPTEYVLGLNKWEHAEAIKDVWDVVLYEFRKFVGLLVKQNPNTIGMLWLEKEDYLHISPIGQTLIDNRNMFRDRHAAHESISGYAFGQLKKMSHISSLGYLGAKRKALVEKHGFDRKNAAHCCRLLHSGIEYLETGELKVRRTWDREMLIDIKTGRTGEWSLEQVQKYAESLFEKMKQASKSNALPESIDYEAVNALVVDCMKKHLLAA